MAKDLPGFYFDTERNRYFPLSSKPATKPQIQSLTSRDGDPAFVDLTTPDTIVRRAGNSLCSRTINQKLLSSPPSIVTQTRSLVNHDILCTRYASTSRFDFSPTSTFGDITAFCSATSDDGQTRRYIGDNKGWLYACSMYSDPSFDSYSEEWSQYATIEPPSAQMFMWPPEINLHSHSQVSSINISAQKCVTTCFGPITKVAIQDLDVSGRTTLITMNQVHDVRASHLQNNALILGAKGRTVYIPDIDISGSVQHLNNSQNSDIFAVERDKSLVYTGARNGSITRFDLRVPPDKLNGQWLFRSKTGAGAARTTTPSSVLYLKLVKDSQLLVSQMNGELCTYDTRFPIEGTPTRTFRGHLNSVTQKLGICVDQAEDFVFAAGEDCRIRGWSLRTGKALYNEAERPTIISSALPHASSSFASSSLSSNYNHFRNPFKAAFSSPISTMQVTQEGGNLCLWGGSHKILYRYFLGQSSLGN